MAKIRDDLDSVVYLDDGSGRYLSAGDTVPRGIEVGEHVAAPSGKGRGRAKAKDDVDVADAENADGDAQDSADADTADDA